MTRVHIMCVCHWREGGRGREREGEGEGGRGREERERGEGGQRSGTCLELQFPLPCMKLDMFIHIVEPATMGEGRGGGEQRWL